MQSEKTSMSAPVHAVVMRHVLFSVMEFDDGTISVMPLHRGTLKECEELATKIPAVCNSTGKRCVSSFLGVLTEEEYDAAIAEPA